MRGTMNKGISFLVLLLLVLGTVFGPALVEANHASKTDLSELAPDYKSEPIADGSIHPAWRKTGLIPTCLD